MDRSGGYSEEENVQLKIYSDQDTHGIVAWFIIIALVLLGIMWHDVYCISRVKRGCISRCISFNNTKCIHYILP